MTCDKSFSEAGQRDGHHFCPLESRPLYGIREGKEHLSYFERFIRYTASSFYREAELSRIRTWKSRERTFYIAAPEREQSMSYPRPEGRKMFLATRVEAVTGSSSRQNGNVKPSPVGHWSFSLLNLRPTRLPRISTPPLLYILLSYR